ncbi:ATP-binding cassette domain-containing protein [Paramicrobacterium agarici]|uniref:ABC-2 type transport system ATP-binding protein n=1 Tax=Paramicrobacterium agarici TaxID=630514 RepID=A0A2A9DVE2_9MICO|nr:ATP-binding cassette domain-containing protein [Microbacterium agarici]PFG30554.1 ABC-2 type transport system ATP-binding protein [Microbacterium agarici]
MVPPFAGRAIESRNLTKRYAQATVVDNLTMTAKPGRVTGFLGPNGAGKSTTMRMLLGLAAPTAGSITVGGAPVSRLREPARVIGALLDARAIHPRRRAVDHLRSYAQAMNLRSRRVDEVLDLVGLSHAGTRCAGDFSLGMHQRLGIATALLGDPAVLVLDEPLNGLDPEGIRWMRLLMRELAADGRTVLFSSHLMSEMELTAHDLIVIHHGRLLAASSLDTFVRTHTSLTVTARSDRASDLVRALRRGGLSADIDENRTVIVHDADTRHVGAVASERGIALTALSTHRSSLEDVFLTLTRESAPLEVTA